MNAEHAPRGLKRVVLETTGWVLVAGGIAALILPGPGLLLLAAGLAILSQQYEWARRRFEPVKRRALQTASDSVQTTPRIVGSVSGSLVLIALGVLWVVRPDVPSWWPLADHWWLFGGWGTGITLIFSGLAALAMIGWSFREYHGAPITR